MNLNLIHLDDALIGQPAFLQACGGLDAVQIDVRRSGPDLRLWATHDDYSVLTDELREKLSGLASTRPLVTWLGSGDFHHVSSALVKLRAEALGKPLTIVHFDNHPDWVSFAGGLHCGSWVRYVLETGAVDRVISLGLTSRDLAWPEFKGAALDLVASGRLVVFPLDPPATVVFSKIGRASCRERVLMPG